MSDTLIARRYATALFKLALETGRLEEILRDTTSLDEVCKKSPEFVQAMTNPVIPMAVKQGMVNKAFTGKISDAMLNFLNFLIEKKRIYLVCEVTEAFLVMEEEHRGIAEARFITARPADKEILETLDAGLSRKYQKKFAIKAEENPEILGGFMLYIKDKVFDFSIKNQIKLLREQLLGTR